MILFLHGTDTYRAQQKLKEIREKYQAAYPHAVQVRDFDCSEGDTQEFKNFLETSSLFESKQFVIFRNLFQNKEFEGFIFESRTHLAESARHIVVVFQAQEIKEKSKHALYQWLQKNTKHQEFLLLPNAKLKLWIEKEFLRYNRAITPRAQETLARSIGNNLWQLSGEIKKIAAWKKTEEDARVKESDIAVFTSVPVDADIFATIEAVAQKNKKQALALLYRHLEKGDAPFYLLSMLQYQFRILLQIRDMVERKLSLGAMLEKAKLHPYIFKKGLRVAERFSLQDLKAIYEKLFVVDRNLKTGKVEPEGVFDLLIARL